MPQVGDFYESYRANEFVVEIGGQAYHGISKVTGLSEGEIETIEQPDGGSGHVYKIAANKVKFEPLTLERYVDGSPEDGKFQEWFRDVFDMTRGTQGSSSVRRSGMVHKYHQGDPNPVVSFVFENAWIKSSKFTDLEAGSTALFKQTIVLEHEGLRRA
jgi:phage tail-like protein